MFSIDWNPLQGPLVLQYKQLHKDCMKHNSNFIAPASIDEMLKVLTNSKRDHGLFWTPVRKINSTSYTHGIGGRSYSFGTSTYLGLELKQFQWEDSYFPVGFGMALKLFFEIDSLKISAKRCALFEKCPEMHLTGF